ncbi:hypothetical protein CHARACLAT_030523 [Characodon lateralis]|uniref:Uncharacterized protein n=1 Tax=Characodon lateralis TaxID=208331 RepID=A0ABU7E4V1_9TELE|nr:hypothetical protein [Characodon lateralis]
MLSRAEKFEETSTVFKQLATANLFSCGEWWLFCRPVCEQTLKSLCLFASKETSARLSPFSGPSRRPCGRGWLVGEGVLLFRQWHHEKSAATPQFLSCWNVQMYTRTGHVTKGGVVLLVYLCARGSTSLESFHQHLNRFIPGTSASGCHFQMYLLEGLTRWNDGRAQEAAGAENEVLRGAEAAHPLPADAELTGSDAG